MKKRVCLTLFLSVMGLSSAPSFAQAPQRLTLKEAEAIALRNHPQVKAAELNALAAQQVPTEVRSAYYPLAFGDLTGVEAQPGSRVAAGGLNNPIIFDRYADGVTVSQLITDFGRTANLAKSAVLRARAEQENTQATRADILIQVNRAYYDALRAQSVLKVAEQTVADRQLIVDQVTALARSKLKSQLDVSFAGVNLAEAKLLRVRAQNDVQASFTALSTALGYQEQQTFELVEEPLPPAPSADLSTLVAEAFRQRPELASLRLDRDAAVSFARAERDLWFPTISALGTAGLIPFRENALRSRYSAAGLNVGIPFFNGHLFSARHAEANLRAQSAGQRLRDLQNRVAGDVRVAWLNANTAFQRLDLTKQLLDEAGQALDLAQARYNLGLSSIVELSQAQLNKTQAEIEQASAKYEYQTDLAALNYQIGLLR